MPKINQVASTLNDVFDEILGTYQNEDGTPVLFKEDLSNFIDAGKKITESTEWSEHFDKYVGKLIDRIGKTVIVDKALGTEKYSLMRDKYEFGALLQKIRIGDAPDFKENVAWKLEKGEYYNYTQFNPVEFEATYWSDKLTYAVEWSWAAKLLKTAMESADAIVRLYTAIENRIMKKAEILNTALESRLVNNMNACNFARGRVVNFIEEYVKATGDASIRSATAMSKVDFLRQCIITLKLKRALLEKPTKKYNNAKELNWTPSADLRMIALVDFDAALSTSLYSNTFNEEYVKFSGYKTTAFWQGLTDADDGDSFNVRSTISVETTEDDQVTTSGIVFTMFDYAGLAMYNEDPDLNTAPFNPKGKFYNYFYSYDASPYYDNAENSITFIISDYSPLQSQPADWGTGTYYTYDPDTETYSEASKSAQFDDDIYFKKIVG